ncbi:Imidazolonepropionase [Erythrobacter litoralis]|uniref:Amidohydrolase n=1 Tax=Erythrobacter litoralis TaxID=39960 RepID=A0A074MUK9_9SPHN|nr:amidohydrolase family protein [Erythrobacter litoralis]AOL24967.1 Imidazolonepropionase [Erythrobacter litoralis]KEO96490.1 amidohydrolase [Erythrobacter litoralis]
MKRLLTLAASVLALASSPTLAQDVVITNAKVVLGDGSDPIENGTVIVRGGEVVAAGANVAIPAGTETLDAGGAWVTPGLFATVTTLGLWDVGAVSESNDQRAGSSPFSAALDAAPIVNPNSQHILVHRAAGITRAATTTLPSASIFAGQGALIDLGADPDPVMRARAFQMVDMGEGAGRIAGGSRAAAHALFRNALLEAQSYGEAARIPGQSATARDVRTGDDVPIDPRLAGRETDRPGDVLLTRFDAAALVPVVRGEQTLYVAVERAADIRAVLALREEFPKLDMVLVGASEGWLVADEIARAGVPVIADSLDDLPVGFDELAATQSNIGRMMRAGVKVAINASAMQNPRRLPQYAGNLVALSRMPGATGLSWGQAFAAITSVPAEISGLGGRAGVLAPGAMGDVVIWDGDPLEVGTVPTRVFIEGVEQPMDSHQSRLKERYLDLDESDLPKAYDW